MFDYIEISKYLSDGYFNSENIETGRLIGGNSTMRVSYNKEKRILKIKGSLPYFIQGHNFWFTRDKLIEAIDNISNLLEVDLYDAEVNIMEYGVVVCPDFDINDFISSHLSSDYYLRDVFEGGGMRYKRRDKSYTLKFYSLWANINQTSNKITKETRRILNIGCYDKKSNAMRYEIHGNPKKILKCGTVFVFDICTDEFENKCKQILLLKYQKINKEERLHINNKRMDNWSISLVRLSEMDNDYQNKLSRMIEKTNDEKQARCQQKKRLKDKIGQIPKEKCSFSIERLIIEAFEN